MTLAALPPPELARRLRAGTLRLRTGPFVTLIRSPLDAVAVALAQLYPGYTVEPDDSFVDFAVSIDRPPGLRRWFKPQIVFGFDGEYPFTPLPGDQGFPMLEWGMNWCVSAHAHQYVTLHSAVLERNGRALILPAPSGSGKSTLCAGLAFGGWRLLSDELALIDPERRHIVPLPRPISLKNASIEVIRRFAPDAVFSRVVHDTNKGSIAHCRAPGQALAKVDRPAPPAWVVVPRYEAGAPPRLAPLPKARAMMHLVDSTFNFNVQRRRAFDLLGELVDGCDCYEFSYSRLEDALPVFAALADGGELPLSERRDLLFSGRELGA